MRIKEQCFTWNIALYYKNLWKSCGKKRNKRTKKDAKKQKKNPTSWRRKKNQRSRNNHSKCGKQQDKKQKAGKSRGAAAGWWVISLVEKCRPAGALTARCCAWRASHRYGFLCRTRIQMENHKVCEATSLCIAQLHFCDSKSFTNIKSRYIRFTPCVYTLPACNRSLSLAHSEFVRSNAMLALWPKWQFSAKYIALFSLLCAWPRLAPSPFRIRVIKFDAYSLPKACFY